MSLATWWRQKSPGGAYWRCEIPAKHLPGHIADIDVNGLEEYEPDKYRLKAQRGNTAIWQFAGNATRGTLIAEQQSQGIRCLIEADDNYLTVAPGMNTDWQVDFARGGQELNGDRSSLAAHKRICEYADGVIVSTERLWDIYSPVNDNVYVCPNSIDPDDWPEPHPRDDEITRIGWAASPSHFVDEPLARQAMEWAVRQPDVEVYLIGHQPRWAGPFKRIPWTDTLKDYRQQLVDLKLDVGICPLKPGVWADCKSDVKALEMAMTGALPVYSNVEPYRAYMGAGIRCKNKRDFMDALRWAVFHQDDVRAEAGRAREYVLKERTIRTAIGRWREVVNG